MPRSALCCALAAALLAALAVAEQRVGLALALTLLITLTTGLLVRRATDGVIAWLPATLAAGLSLQPVLRDAGWVVGVCVVGSLVAGAAAVLPATGWRSLVVTVLAPLRVLAGATQSLRAVRALLPPGAEVRAPHGLAVVRGGAAALVLLLAFGGLFAAADPAFADIADGVFSADVDPSGAIIRVGLGLLFLGGAGALALAAERAPSPHEEPGGWVPPRTELTIALGALTLLFGLFVAVQLRVLFGGAAYVEQTTGLGYGDYARKGFAPLLAVSALTLALVAAAARRRERGVRGLLGALCLLTLVVIASAHLRLGLVEDVYGLTRTRFAGHAVVLWLGALFLIVLAAGADRRVAAAAPRIVLAATLAAVLGLALANPDGLIAGSALARFERTGELDEPALASLSADALPQIRRLPADRQLARERPTAGLARPDGLLGFNLARARAR